MAKKMSFFIIFFLCFFLPVPGNIIDVNSPDIKIQVKSGFEGYYQYQKWFPVTVTVENTGPFVSGNISIKTYVNSGYVQSVKKHVELPSNSFKKFQLYMSPAYGYYYGEDFIVDIEGPSGKVVASTRVNMSRMEAGQSLVLVLSKDKAGLNYLGGPQTNLWKGSNLLVLYPEVNNLPSEWIGYDAVDFIILNNFSVNSLDGYQKKALHDWIKRGGKLIISSSSNPLEFQDTFLQEAIPLELTSSCVLSDLSSLVSYSGKSIKVDAPGVAVVKGNMKEGQKGHIIVEQDNIPLVVKSDYGTGTIIFLSFDISKAPFIYWRDRLSFWGKLLNDELFFYKFIPGSISDNDVSSILYDIPLLKPPSFKFVGLFLFIYILVTGPINYFILKKLDKREFAVFTVPVMVILFSLATYVTGYTLKGGNLILTELSVVKYSNSGFCNIETFVSLFSPNRKDYKMEFQDKGAFADFITRDYSQENSIVSKQEDYMSFEPIHLNMWSMMTFGVSGFMENQGNLYVKDVNISYNGVTLSISGKVVNNTGKTFNDCSLLLNKDGGKKSGKSNDDNSGKSLQVYSLMAGHIGNIPPGEIGFQADMLCMYKSTEISADWKKHYSVNTDEKDGKLKYGFMTKALEEIFSKREKVLFLTAWNKDKLLNINLNAEGKRDYINLFLFNLMEGDEIIIK